MQQDKYDVFTSRSILNFHCDVIICYIVDNSLVDSTRQSLDVHGLMR